MTTFSFVSLFIFYVQKNSQAHTQKVKHGFCSLTVRTQVGGGAWQGSARHLRGDRWGHGLHVCGDSGAELLSGRLST